MQGDLLDGVRHPVDDLTAVRSGIFLGQEGDGQSAAAAVGVCDGGAVHVASVGVLMHPHGKEHVFVEGFICSQLGPLHPDANTAEGRGVFVVEVAGHCDVVANENGHYDCGKNKKNITLMLEIIGGVDATWVQLKEKNLKV